MKSFKRDIFPLKVDGEVVRHKSELKKYNIGPRDGSTQKTLWSVYQTFSSAKFRDGEVPSFEDYVDIWCDNKGIDNPYTVKSMNVKSKSFRGRVSDILVAENEDALIRRVLEIAMSNDRDRMKAIELLSEWLGANEVVEVSKEESDEPINIIPG